MSEQWEWTAAIRAPADAVWAIVCDPLNDLKWCSRLATVEQREGRGAVVGARYEGIQRPTFTRRSTLWIELTRLDPPREFVSIQVDDTAAVTVTYRLEAGESVTRITQRDEIKWKLPFYRRPFARRVRRLAVKQQLAELRRILEEG